MVDLIVTFSIPAGRFCRWYLALGFLKNRCHYSCCGLCLSRGWAASRVSGDESHKLVHSLRCMSRSDWLVLLTFLCVRKNHIWSNLPGMQWPGIQAQANQEHPVVKHSPQNCWAPMWGRSFTFWSPLKCSCFTRAVLPVWDGIDSLKGEQVLQHRRYCLLANSAFSCFKDQVKH